MKVEILPAGVAPPGQKTPAPFTPARGKTVQTVPQKARVLPVLANLKPNYVPPAVRAAMAKGQAPNFARGIPTPGQPPVGVGSGMVRRFNPAALDGLGNLGTASMVDGRECPACTQSSHPGSCPWPAGQEWERYCDCMAEKGTPAWNACNSSWPSAPWTSAGKFMALFGGTKKVVTDIAPVVIPGGGQIPPGSGFTWPGTGTGGGGQTGTGGSKTPVAPTDDSSTTTIAIVAAGVVAVGGLGYLFLRSRAGRSAPMGSFSRRVRKSRRNRK